MDMNFDLSRLNPVYTSKTPCEGNVYAAQGGKKDGTRFWVILAIRWDGCVLLGINTQGEIISTQGYSTHVMAAKPLIGWCPGVMDLNLEIEGIPG